MSDNEMLYCLVAFIVGWMLCKHMGNGNGFSVGAPHPHHDDLPLCRGDVGYLHNHGQFRNEMDYAHMDPCAHDHLTSYINNPDIEPSEFCKKYYQKDHHGNTGLICEAVPGATKTHAPLGTFSKHSDFLAPCRASTNKCRVD